MSKRGELQNGNCDDEFFRLYSDVEALSRETKTSGEALEFFHHSREKLEKELQRFYSESKNLSNARLREISARHSFLALIHWLYPNHIGYNRTQNALVMFQHASAAQATSESKMDFPYCVGLLIQLRITPFLVKSKKKSIGDLEAIRKSATEFISGAEYIYRDDLSSLVSDGLGFSYFLFERDLDTAQSYISRSASNISDYERRNSRESQVKARFFASFASAIYWDLGICYEGKVESAEGDEMLDFLEKARLYYQRSYDYAMKSPWHIYRAMSAYNLSGTYFREGMSQFERKKALPLLAHSVSIGEESLKWFNLWSSLERDFLGGSWIASFYQRLADYSESPSEKRRYMQRSLELARRADELINNRKVGLSRYKAANIGDIFLRNSEYNRQVAIDLRVDDRSRETQNENPVPDLLRRALADCLKSRTFFRDQAFRSRKLSSSLLAGDICYDLSGEESLTNPQRKMYLTKAKRYFHEASKISKSSGLSETLATSSWRLAQVSDREGQFKRSAIEYQKACEAFELVRHSSSNSLLYEESSIYMRAWSDVEKAKSAHVSSDFEGASRLYMEASDLIATTRRWRSRAHLYSAESFVEQAEKLSLVESSSDCVEFFSRAKQSLTVLESDLSSDESIEGKSFKRLGRHLSSFCDARITLEKSKKDFRTGNVNGSVDGLVRAENIFSDLAQDCSQSNPLESNEMSSLSSLCRALKYFQKAQIDGDANLIRKASEIFSDASDRSSSASLKPLLKGLSSFASFLYSSKLVEQSLDSSIDIERLSECGKALDSAERILSRLGERSFLSMLRASKHVLDASIKISAAEREIENQDAKAKLYSQAQRSLTLAARYYNELGSSEKLKESLHLISTVKQNRELIPLANKMFTEMVSSQMIYSAVSSTSILDSSPENSARQLESSFVVLDTTIENPLISLGDDLKVSFVLSNFGKERGVALRIQEANPEGFELVSLSQREGGSPKFKDRSILLSIGLESGASETITLLARPNSCGEFIWQPALVFEDSQGNKTVVPSETLKVVVEADNFASIIKDLKSKKQKIEDELKKDGSSDDQILSLREDLSKAEEELNRLNNEYENLIAQLGQIRQDLGALNAIQDNALKLKERTKLETEEKILAERIERRRHIFQS